MLNATEKALFMTIVDTATSEMSNNCCNDYPVRVTKKNRGELCQFIDLYVADQFGEDDEYKESLLAQLEEGEVYFLDYAVLQTLANKCVM